ncbi:MAG: ribonuclease R [Bacteroidales bacterium]|nr:ribonuclease R [Bacteroidales bacterium]
MEEKNSYVKSLLKIFAKTPFDALNYKQVASRMGAFDKGSRKMIADTILSLAEEKILIEERKGKYKIDPKYINDDLLPQNYVVGTIDMKQTGKAYVIPNNDTMDDIMISANNTRHALHGDTVKVLLFPARRMHKQEGQVVEIIQRAKTRFVGRIQLQSHFAFLIPDNKSMAVDIFIPLDNLNNAKNGDKALVEMTEWPKHLNNPVGKVVQVLGKPGDNNVEMQSILAEFDFPLSFPKEVEKAADKISMDIPEEEIAKRKDFRSITTFTIDPADAKDFDDALSIRKLDNGNYEIGVHIADVSHYVIENGAIDHEAYNRGTSVYLVDRTIPMLPERLCNGVCSLRPNEDKLCFSAVFEMNNDAVVINKWFGKTVINSDRRFSYEEAQAVIETGEGELKEEILKLNSLATILREQRYKNGAINFDTKEVKFILDENAKPIGVYTKESKEANFLIEEFMLLANRSVAEHIGKVKERKKAKTFVYRVHDEPNPEKLGTFVQFVAKLGYKIKTTSRKTLADSFNKLFVDIEGKGEQNMIDSIAIRTMSKAYYSTDNIGHYGLGFPYYTHFTSPIRRYPDLMVHRLLYSYLNNASSANIEFCEEQCKHSSLMERKAAEAERTSVKYKQAEFLSDKIGQEFPALISGVSKWGIYAEIEENKCEGMISLGSLQDDYYYLDEDNYQVIGRRYGRQYKLGDSIRIKVLRVDMEKKQMDFALIETEEPMAPRSSKPEKKKTSKAKSKTAKKEKKTTKSKKTTGKKNK